MKISLFTVLSLIAFTGAAEVKVNHLRSAGVQVMDAATTTATKKKKKDKTLAHIGTEVIVSGANQDAGENYTPVLSKCFVEAYNGHDMAGFKMEGFKPDREVDVPEDDDEMLTDEQRKLRRSHVSQYFWGRSNYWGCGKFCGRDDDEAMGSTPLEFLAALDHPSAAERHVEFEHALCGCLKESGLKTYKHATACDVRYMYGGDAGPTAAE